MWLLRRNGEFTRASDGIEDADEAVGVVGVDGEASADAVNLARIFSNGFAAIGGERGVGCGGVLGRHLTLDPKQGEQLTQTLFNDRFEGGKSVQTEVHVHALVRQNRREEHARKTGQDDDGGDFLRRRSRDAVFDHVKLTEDVEH